MACPWRNHGLPCPWLPRMAGGPESTGKGQVNTHDILAKALDTLRSKGWVKKIYVDKHDHRCMIGALDHAVTIQDVPSSRKGPRRLLAEVIREQYPRRLPKDVDERSDDNSVIVDFNDRPSTRFADVERVFEKAIVRAEEEDE